MRTVRDIAEGLGFDAVGDLDIVITRPAHPIAADETALALAMDPKYLPLLEGCRARAAMTPPGADYQALGLEAAIYAPRARYAMAGVTQLYAAPIDAPAGVHESAVVAGDADIGEGAHVGPFAVIGAGARIGARTALLGQCSVGAGAEVGADGLIKPGVRIGAGVSIGARAIVHENSVIGADGFSFVTPEPGSVESAKAEGRVAVGAENRVWVRIHSLGAVKIGDDVEIGACAAIDRGTVADTTIGHGCKIDNQVQIGHNVRIGENCMLCGQVGLAGSAVLGDRVVMGGKSGAADHAMLGDDVLVMANSGVSGKVASRSIMGGSPALPRDDLFRMLGHMRRLPRFANELEALKKRLSDLDSPG